MEKSTEIVVVGSTNVDMVARVAHLPLPGETIGEAEYSVAYGGKGANQAVAAAKAGGHVTFVSYLGEDVYTDALLASFKEAGINTEYIRKLRGVSTGVALIFVSEAGENSIAVAPGANGLLQGDGVRELFPLIERAGVLVLQLEIPFPTVTALVEYAHSVGTKVVLNPAPAKKIPLDLLRQVDVLILNETEAAFITGKSFQEAEAMDMAQYLCGEGVQTVILTLGKKGSVVAGKGLAESIPSYKVKAVDTTGAGDTFCGAFVARWMEGSDVLASVRFATAAAALSVTRAGAQPSIPSKEEVLEFVSNEK